MRVVIIGAGEVGFHTARMLSGEGHRVIVVEQDEAVVEHTSQRLDALVIQGNGASPKVLREAGVEKSDLLVAVTSTDEVNIVASLAAKAQGVPRTVARIHNPDYDDGGSRFSKNLLGMDFVVRTEQMAAKEISEVLLVPGAVNVETFAGGTIEVVEVVLKEDSPAVKRAVRDVELPGEASSSGWCGAARRSCRAATPCSRRGITSSLSASAAASGRRSPPSSRTPRRSGT